MSTEPTPEPRPLPPDAPEQPDPVLGRVMSDRYRVEALIARGGMARIYRARDVRLERDVAVKVLSPPFADDPAFTDRFLAEARAAASLSHPSLVHVYDSGSDGALHFIVMELLDRHQPLRDVLEERGRLAVAETATLGRELLAGLRVVHERGLVHCDVKTANVMIGPGPPKLIDFGIARTPHDAEDGSTSIGSLHYMSPEQLGGQPLTPASDLFALGVVLYEAITGQVPYAGDSPAEVAAAHAAERLRPPSTLVEAVPGRLDAAILQALRRDPEARFRSAEAMDRAIGASIEERDREETRVVHRPSPQGERAGYVPPVAPAPPPVREVPPRPRPGRRGGSSAWGWISTALILGAAALVVFFIVVPLLQIGREGDPGPGGGTGSSATPLATATAAPGTVTVPDTIGLATDDAIRAATDAGLNWTVRCNHDEAQRAGIVDQEPGAGTPVAPGSRFTMYSARIGDCE